MAENTLSQVASLPDVFDRIIVKTRLAPQERYALSILHGSKPGPQALQATVRDVLCDGMALNGWSEDRRVEEYAAYKAECLRRGVRNEFEG